ncbi:hypothetical protein D3C78_1436590 [compost metagenome]
MLPSCAMLPYSTAKPPSWLNAFSSERIQPSARSSSSVSQRQSCENAWVVRMPAGPARNIFFTASSLVSMMSYRSSVCGRVRPSMLFTSRFNRPARSSSPRIASTPPARCTSSIWYFGGLGATLHRCGTLRDRRSISSMVKSISPSCAAANRCSTVLVEPPMAISSVMAFSNAALLAMLRGSALSSSCS